MGNKDQTKHSRKKKRIPPSKRRKIQPEQQEDDESIASCSQPTELSTNESSSANKLTANIRKATQPQVQQDYDDHNVSEGNGIVNISLLVNFIKQFPCQQCKEPGIDVSVERIAGLAQSISAVCSICQHRANQELSTRMDGKLFSY